MQGILAIVFFPETPARKNSRFGGTFENSIGYVYREKRVPRCWGQHVKKRLHGLYALHVRVSYVQQIVVAALSAVRA